MTTNDESTGGIGGDAIKPELDDNGLADNAQSAALPDNDHFPFLKLPAELRTRVYYYVCGYYHFRIGSSHRTQKLHGLTCCTPDGAFLPPYHYFNYPNLRILSTNHQVGEEAAQALYSTLTFHVGDATSLGRLLTVVPTGYLSLITSLEFTIMDAFYWYMWSAQAKKGFTTMKALKYVEIALLQGYGSSRRTITYRKFQQTHCLPRLQDGVILLRLYDNRPSHTFDIKQHFTLHSIAEDLCCLFTRQKEKLIDDVAETTYSETNEADQRT